MEESKTTIQVATDVCKQHNLEVTFTTTQCHLNRKTLTRIMTSDQMLAHLGIRLSESNNHFLF